MKPTRFLLCSFLLPLFLPHSVNAQTLQLPAIGINTVQTTVSVPDRGSALLGGVSRGAEASNRFGFSPIWSSVGRTHSAASQRVFVEIHDFEAADQGLLSAPRRDRRPQPQFRNAHAMHAWEQLRSRN